MKVIILHRTLGTPYDDWYPWLSEKLREEGIEVEIPELSPGGVPHFESWMGVVNKMLADADKETFVVGHSLSNTIAFKVLENFPLGKSVGGMVVAAGMYEVVGELPPSMKFIKKFFEEPVDWNKVKRAAGKIAVFHDKKDDHVPFANGEMISKKLGTKLIATEGKGHYMIKSFPELLDVLCKMIHIV